jgi:hypothetical protein
VPGSCGGARPATLGSCCHWLPRGLSSTCVCARACAKVRVLRLVQFCVRVRVLRVRVLRVRVLRLRVLRVRVLRVRVLRVRVLRVRFSGLYGSGGSL